MINVIIVSDNNQWNKRIKKKFFFKSLVSFFPKKYKFIGKKIGLTILLSNNKNIKKINKKFRNKNKATDILSFPNEKKFNKDKSNYLGDMIISYDYINRPKSISSLDFKQKLTKIFIHGFLHLLNYDHIRFKDFKRMLKEEEKIFNNLKSKIKKIV
jgi:probable rRNA maturation factor